MPPAPRPGITLLERLKALIERLHGLDTGGLDPARFLIGDAGLFELYRHRRVLHRDPRDPAGPMLLVRSHGGDHHVRIYYPNRLIRNLERHDPSRGLSRKNFGDFAGFVEELDHLLVLADNHRRGREVRGVELELHGNVTKVLVLSLFLARTLGVSRLSSEQRLHLRWELLGRGDYGDEAPDLRDRYREARRRAVTFLDRLQLTPPRQRPALLRRFSRAPWPEKLRLCA